MKRRAKKRYGHAVLFDPRRNYYARTLAVVQRLSGGSRSEVRRVMMMEAGVHRAVTDRVLAVAERRGHVAYRGGRFYLMPKGYDAVWPIGVNK